MRAIALLAGSAAVIAAVAYAAGRRRAQSASSSGAQSTSSSCECGAELAHMTAADVQRHRLGRRHKLSLKIVVEGAKIRVCDKWAEYRPAIDDCVHSGDAVLEVGCHQGVTTALIAKRARRTVGADLSALVIGMARERFPSIQFECANAADVKALRELGPFDVIFVDINGDRELQTLLPLLESYEAVLAPRMLVVKNIRLARLLLKCSRRE